MIAIIDYNAGNLKSVEKALHFLEQPCVITRDRSEILAADHVILPGVGAFGDAMEQLKKYELDKVIREVAEQNKPLLGIRALRDYISWTGRCFVFRTRKDLRFRISAGTHCRTRIRDGCLQEFRRMHMYISCIPII